MVHLGVGFQFSCVGDTSLVSCEGETVVDEVEFVGGAENGTQAVEAVSFCYCMGKDFGVGMAVGGIKLDVKLIGEYFFSIARYDEGEKR